MKIIYILLLAVFFNQLVYSQSIINELKKFYHNAPIDCYIDKIKKNIMDEDALHSQGLLFPTLIPPTKINLNKDNIVPILTIQFVGTENFNYGNNIYNHICIDSSRVFMMACVDNNMNVYGFANYFGGFHTYYDVKFDETISSPIVKLKLKHLIRNINKQNPELILYCHVLAGWGDNSYNGFMFIKGNNIYVYNFPNGKIFELNNFIHKYYSLKRVRDLNHEFIPIIYSNCSATRRTGHTPENEKMICH
ncbi:MAG: hypothetical protein WCK78_05185 [Paludibacter sp.]